MRYIRNTIQLKEAPLPDEWYPIVKKYSQNREEEIPIQDILNNISKDISDISFIKDGKNTRLTQMVGFGSSRKVFKVISGSQVGSIYKFPYNDKGIAQNKIELNVCLDIKSKENPLLIKLIDYDTESDEYKKSKSPLWIQFEELTNINHLDDFDKSIWFPYFSFSYYAYVILISNLKARVEMPQSKEFYEMIKRHIVAYDSKRKPKNLSDKEYTNKCFTENKDHWDQLLDFLKIIKKYDLLFGDMQVYENWGIRSNSIPVFLDMGIDQKTYSKLYIKK